MGKHDEKNSPKGHGRGPIIRPDDKNKTPKDEPKHRK